METGPAREYTPLFCCRKFGRGGIMFGNLRPVDYFPKGAKVIGAFVLVFEVVGVFPNVDTQDRGSFYFGYIHQGVVLVRGGADLQFAVLTDEPGPATAKTAHSGGVELFLEGIEAAKGCVNVVGQRPGRGAGSIGCKDLPEKAMVPVTAGVIADGW